MERDLQNAYREMVRGFNPKKGTARQVYIVHGAPGSGKTTWVKEHKAENDLVVDMDYLCAALNGSENIYQEHKPFLDEALRIRELLYDSIAEKKGAWNRAYVITATRSKSELNQLADRLQAEIVHMPASKETCIERIKQDERRGPRVADFIKMAEEWSCE